MPKAKRNKPPFYPLTEQEIIELSLDGLTRTEILVYLFHLVKAYRGVRGKVMDTAVVAEKLNISRRATQKSLKTLQDKGYVSIELRSYGYICQKNSGEQEFVSANGRSPENEQEFAVANGRSPASPETPSGQGFQKCPEYIQNIYISLSSRERENFLYYIKERCSTLDKQPANLEDWIFSIGKSGRYRIEYFWEEYQFALASEADLDGDEKVPPAKNANSSFLEQMEAQRRKKREERRILAEKLGDELETLELSDECE